MLINLLTNARDALNDKYSVNDSNKMILLSAVNFVREEKRWIRIIVEDHGNGIPESIQSMIFENFFTTKQNERGTGLGLAISYGIIKEHDGTLTYETVEGEYTKFFVDLPVD